MIARLAAAIGLPVSTLAWIGFALAVAGSAAVSGSLVHSYDRAQHDKVVADLRRDAATTLADQTEVVLRLLQDRIDQVHQLEEDYARASEERSRLAADGVRLSADLGAARQRLLQLARAGGGGGGGTDGKAGAGAVGCDDVRTALARAAAALELYEKEGDRVAEDGQHAVDVATIAAKDARQREMKR